MTNNSIIYLILFIIVIIIIVNHLKCKGTIENFNIDCNKLDNNSTKEEIEQCIKDNIDSIKQKRTDISENVTQKKKNKKVKYIVNLIEKLNKQKEELNKTINSKKKINIEKIKKIKKLILYLSNIITENTLDLNTNVNSIKSLKDGLKISIKKSAIDDKYLINLTDTENKFNNSCLSINSDSSLSTDLCDINDPKQYFELNNILNPSMYKENIDQSIYNPYTGNDLEYPFTIVKSFHNNNCLKNENGAVSVVPCVIKKAQRWRTFEDKINCSN